MTLLLSFIFLFLFTNFVVAEECFDIDPSACALMAQERSDLCSHPTLSKTACPKFCNLCPISCYNCNATVQDYHFCANKVSCPHGNMCMLKKMKSVVDGRFEYEMTCASKQNCDDPWNSVSIFGKRHIESRDISIHCCASDLCNYPEQTTTTPTSTSTQLKLTKAIIVPTHMSTTTRKPPTSTTTKATTTLAPSTKATTTHTPITKATTTHAPITKATTTTGTPKPTPRTTKPTTTPLTTTKHIAGCVRDVVFVIDESIKFEDHSTDVKAFLHDVVSRLPISSSGVHVALGMFTNAPRTVFDLNTYHSKSSLLRAINDVTLQGGTGDINAGLHYILDQALTQHAGDRPNVPNTVVILSDNTNHIRSSLPRDIHHKATVIAIEVHHADFHRLASDIQYLMHVQATKALAHIDDDVVRLIC